MLVHNINFRLISNGSNPKSNHLRNELINPFLIAKIMNSHLHAHTHTHTPHLTPHPSPTAMPYFLFIIILSCNRSLSDGINRGAIYESGPTKTSHLTHPVVANIKVLPSCTPFRLWEYTVGTIFGIR